MEEKKIKVCHMALGHWPEDVRIFRKECISLARSGYEVYLVQTGDSYVKDGVHIVGIGEAYQNRRKRMTEGKEKVYEASLRVDADIYHFHEPELLPLGLRLKKKGKVVVFDSHEHTAEALREKTYLPKPVRYFVRKAFGAYQTRVCRKIDAVITATPNVTEYFTQRGCRAIDVMNYPIIRPKTEHRNDDGKTVAYIANLDPQWNHAHSINALAGIPDAKLIICGRGSGNQLEMLKQLPGWPQVDYRGKVSHDEVAQVLSASDVGLTLLSPGANTDYQNGNLANTKLFEAMMAGLPVVCTNFVRWKQIMEQYDCGICVDPCDEEAIAEAIRYLFANRDRARQMGENGRKAVEDRFNWSSEEKKLLELYHSLEETVRTKTTRN